MPIVWFSKPVCTFACDADSAARNGVALPSLFPLLYADRPPLSLPVSMYRRRQPPTVCPVYRRRRGINAYVRILRYYLSAFSLRWQAAV